MEAKGVVVVQRGTGDGASEGSRFAKARYHEGTGDDVQESDIRRTYRDEPAQQGKVLYPLRVYAV